MPSLAEQYRPTSWNDVIGQSKIVGQLKRLAETRGLAGRAYWISGQSGQGKTTIGRLIAQEVADDDFIHEIDATGLTVSELEDLEKRWQSKGGNLWSQGKKGRAFLINEAHGLRKDVIRKLLVVLERLPAHVVVIFTTTTEGEESLFEDYDDACPLLSRCLVLNLSRRDLAKPFAARAKEIAEKEKLDGRPIEAYIRLAQDCRNNFRAILSAIESGAMLAPE
jgi:replication-associated recombination protein RarA